MRLTRDGIEYYPRPDSSGLLPEKLPLKYYRSTPRAAIDLLQTGLHGNGPGAPLLCAPTGLTRK